MILEVFFPDDVLEVKGRKCIINGEEFGEFIPLSISSKYKSVSYPEVNKIIYDEFLIDKGSIRYLKNEVDVFLELYETIARMRDDVRAIFLANAISIVNPYFLYWNIKPDLRRRFTVKDHVIIEFFKDADYIEQKKKTRFGQLVSGTTYGDYSIDNNFLRDNDTFIEKKTPNSEFVLALKYNGYYYGFWVDYEKGLMYCNNQYDPSSYSKYSITKDDHDPNLLLIKSLSTCKPMQRIVYAFEHGLIRFDDMQVKNQFYEFISYFVR